MMTHLRSYYKIGAPGHELVNDKWIIDLCHDVECIMFDNLQKIQDKISNHLSKWFCE